jgi:TFIIF-interacting CTD phosphatase-like protein
MVIVDESAAAYFFQIDQGIPILPFTHYKKDSELKKLIPYAKALARSGNMVEFNRNYFKTHLHLSGKKLEDVKAEMFK